MKPYRIIFSDNNIVTCAEVSGRSQLDGGYYFEYDRGKMIFAVVNAEDADKAQQIGTELVKKLETKELTSF